MFESNATASLSAGPEMFGLTSDLSNTTKTNRCDNLFSDDIFQAFLNARLSGYKQHQLDDLKQAKLMDRIDTKFLLPRKMLPVVLSELKGSYSNLIINGDKVFTYRNQYFDTQDMAFYNAHHNGKANRYKVRIREYVESELKYLEIKRKNNKKRTLKTRMKLADQMNPSSSEFVLEQSGLDLSNLAVVQNSGYQRVALANESQAERLTLDFNLWYQSPGKERVVKLEDVFIAELKQEKLSRASLFYQLMSHYGFYPVSFSKYCVGCALLFGKKQTNASSSQHFFKTNRFKPILTQLNKIEHEVFLH